MTPKCERCGRFTTAAMIRTGSSSSGYYEEVETWFCVEHAPSEAEQ